MFRPCLGIKLNIIKIKIQIRQHRLSNVISLFLLLDPKLFNNLITLEICFASLKGKC